MIFETQETKEAWLEVVKSLHNPKTTAENPFFNSKYAPLNEVLEYLKAEFLKKGFVIVQEIGYELGVCRVRTEFISDKGTAKSEWAGSENKKDPQATMASSTYLRRCQLLSICGLVGEADDDGNKGAGRQDETEEKISACKTDADLTKLYKSLDKKQQEKYLNKFQERKGEINAK